MQINSIIKTEEERVDKDGMQSVASQTFTALSINSGNLHLRYSASSGSAVENAADVSYGCSLTNLRELCSRISRSHRSLASYLSIYRDIVTGAEKAREPL